MTTKEKFEPGLVATLIVFALVNVLLAVHYWQEEKEVREWVNQREQYWNSYFKSLENQSHPLTDWEVLQMAMVMTESQFNPQAVGKDGDWGIFQQVPIYVAECNRILTLRGEDTRYTHQDSFDIAKSIEMFNLLQSHYNPDQDIDRAIRYQNKAGWYKKRVKDNIEFILRMEEVRRQLKSSRDI